MVVRAAAPLLLFVVLTLGGWHIWRFAAFTGEALLFRYPLDGLEGTLLFEARLLRAGEPLYQPIQPDRFISAPYQPLSYLALLLAEQLAYRGGAPPPDVTVGPIFLPGRTVSLAGMLGAGLLIGLAARRLSRSWAALFIALALWLAFPPVALWATRIKPDPLALGFTAAGLAVAAGWIGRWTVDGGRWTMDDGRSRLMMAALLFACAFFTKQTAVAAPLAVGLVLLVGGRERGQLDGRARLFALLRAPLIFGGTYLALIATSWFVLDIITSGQYSAHVWGLHRTEWWSFGLFRKYFDLLLYNWPLLMIGVLTMLLWARQRVREWMPRANTVEDQGVAPDAKALTPSTTRFVSLPALSAAEGSNGRADPRPPLPFASQTGAGEEQPTRSPTPNPRFLLLPACYLLTALPTLLAAGAEGAHHNHLLEPYLALTLAAATIAARGWPLRLHSAQRENIGCAGTVHRPLSTVQNLATLLSLLLIITQLWLLRERPAWYGGEFDLASRERSRFIELIQSQPGEVLADDIALLLAAGRPLRYDDPSTMGPAARLGIWDESNLLAEVAAQRFDLILLPFDATRLDSDPSGRWTAEFIATLREHYTLLYRDVIFSYVPRR